MRADRFDDLTRRLADAAGASGTRRSVLQANGVGGAAVSLGPSLTSAEPTAAPADAIEDLAFELEFDIDRIFRFVRDEVVYDPYAGVLRGARGRCGAWPGTRPTRRFCCPSCWRPASSRRGSWSAS